MNFMISCGIVIEMYLHNVVASKRKRNKVALLERLDTVSLAFALAIP